MAAVNVDADEDVGLSLCTAGLKTSLARCQTGPDVKRLQGLSIGGTRGSQSEPQRLQLLEDDVRYSR